MPFPFPFTLLGFPDGSSVLVSPVPVDSGLLLQILIQSFFLVGNAEDDLIASKDLEDYRLIIVRNMWKHDFDSFLQINHLPFFNHVRT